MCDQEKIYGFYSGHQDAEPDPARLSEQGVVCDYVMLSVWTARNDGQDTLKAGLGAGLIEEAEIEVFWGFENECVHPLYPGQTTILIPVNNLQDISVRCNKNAVTVMIGFSCFRKKETVR